MVLGFFTGCESDVGLELELRHTARHYIRTRFAIDFVVVLYDWTAAVVDQLSVGGGDFTQTSTVLRTVKLQRLFRLFRAMRMIGVVSWFFDHLDLRLGASSGMVVVVCRVFIFLLFTWLNHLISCAWLCLGFHGPSDTGMRWIDLSAQTGH